MSRIKIFEKAATLCGYSLNYIKYDNNMHILFAEGYICNVPYKVRWNSMGICSKLNGTLLPQYDLPLESAIELLKLEEFKDVCR